MKIMGVFQIPSAPTPLAPVSGPVLNPVSRTHTHMNLSSVFLVGGRVVAQILSIYCALFSLSTSLW